MGLKRYTLLDIVGEMKAPFADPRSIQRSDVRDMALQAWELTPREQFNLLTMSYDKEVHTHPHVRTHTHPHARARVRGCVRRRRSTTRTCPTRLPRCGHRAAASAAVRRPCRS